jgi:hypothetical protein
MPCSLHSMLSASIKLSTIVVFYGCSIVIQTSKCVSRAFIPLRVMVLLAHTFVTSTNPSKFYDDHDREAYRTNEKRQRRLCYPTYLRISTTTSNAHDIVSCVPFESRLHHYMSLQQTRAHPLCIWRRLGSSAILVRAEAPVFEFHKAAEGCVRPWQGCSQFCIDLWHIKI